MIFFKFKKFIKLMKDELFRKKPKNNHFSWSVNETRYLDLERVRKLRKTYQQAKDKALRENKIVPVRDWFMVGLGLFTGLRVEEMVNLKASDLHLKEEQSSLSVKKGKGDKQKTIYFPETFKNECLFYLNWKEKTISQNDYLFTNSSGQQLTKRALQKAFKRCIALAGLETHYSIHCLRHTYGSFLLWVKSYYSGTGDDASGVVVDSQDNIIIAGTTGTSKCIEISPGVFPATFTAGDIQEHTKSKPH